MANERPRRQRFGQRGSWQGKAHAASIGNRGGRWTALPDEHARGRRPAELDERG